MYAGTGVISVTDSTECVNERGKQKQENLNSSEDGIAILNYHLHELEKKTTLDIMFFFLHYNKHSNDNQLDELSFISN